LEAPPSREEWREILRRSGEGIHAFLNRKGNRFRELGLADQERNVEEWMDLLAKDGMLIKRPLLVGRHQAVAGFDVEKWEELIGQP
jgi:arsenate reductase